MTYQDPNQQQGQQAQQAPYQQEYQQPYQQHYQQPYQQPYGPPRSDKDKMTALLLAIFLGGLGIHQFYVGKTGMGILYLFTAGLFGIGTIIDIIKIATGKFTDKNGLLLREN